MNTPILLLVTDHCTFQPVAAETTVSDWLCLLGRPQSFRYVVIATSALQTLTAEIEHGFRFKSGGFSAL